MDKMKKIIIFLIIIVVIGVISIPSKVTPKGYYHASKIARQNMINDLKKNCLSKNTIYLISTYNDVFNDKNTSLCWAEYMEKCLHNKENNLSLELPIDCPTY